MRVSSSRDVTAVSTSQAFSAFCHSYPVSLKSYFNVTRSRTASSAMTRALFLPGLLSTSISSHPEASRNTQYTCSSGAAPVDTRQ